MSRLTSCSCSAPKYYFSGCCRDTGSLGQIPATIAGYLLHAMMAVRGESKILGYSAQYSLFGTCHPGMAGRPLIVQTRGSIIIFALVVLPVCD